MTNRWADLDHAGSYLARADRLPHRREGEDVLVDDLGPGPLRRVLDLGCGDGRLTACVLAAFPEASAVGVDLSPTMLDAARARFAGDPRVTLLAARLEDPLPVDGPFDAVVSSLAIHHVEHERKRSLFAEITALLAPGGVFANLDIVESPTPSLHARWRDEMGAPDDPSDRLAPMADQLAWLSAAGLVDVDCIWKWRGLALLRGQRSAG